MATTRRLNRALGKKLEPPIFALVLLQDLDDDPDRADGLAQARDEAIRKGERFAVVFGCPNQCHEAWLLACLKVTNSHQFLRDHSRASSASKELRRRTTASPEELLRNTALDTMETFGKTNGLDSFLQDLRAEVAAPLLKAAVSSIE